MRMATRISNQKVTNFNGKRRYLVHWKDDLDNGKKKSWVAAQFVPFEVCQLLWDSTESS